MLHYLYILSSKVRPILPPELKTSVHSVLVRTSIATLTKLCDLRDTDVKAAARR